MNLMRNASEAIPEGCKVVVITSTEGGYFKIEIVANGTGLGITVCCGILKDHGGYLKYSSKIGKSTTTTVLLPLVRVET